MTANALTVPPGGSDPYSNYGARVDKTGAYLSFKNGEFNYGKIGAKLELGTRMIADMPGLRVGWKCWKGGRVVADLMNLLTDNNIALRRNLGDDDEELWDCDERGQPRDPWQFVNELTLCRDDGENFIFSTSSRGGIGAIGKLCKEYGKARREHAGSLPVIELAADFYMHTQYGKTYFPVFILVGWIEDPAAIEAAPPAPRYDQPALGRELDDEIPF